jgi:hypothetical protein
VPGQCVFGFQKLHFGVLFRREGAHTDFVKRQFFIGIDQTKSKKLI